MGKKRRKEIGRRGRGGYLRRRERRREGKETEERGGKALGIRAATSMEGDKRGKEKRREGKEGERD